ncbi:MAG: HAD-IIB family hydrolase [Patescibacteria group bacterium]
MKTSLTGGELSVLKEKKLIVFDLDGTLAESKSGMDSQMAGLMRRLLNEKMVAVISGGRYEQFERQFLKSLKCPKSFYARLFLFPTSSTSFYRYLNGWKKVYAENLTSAEKRKILSAFKGVFAKVRYAEPSRTYGVVIEDRETQITFSALGQKAPVGEKKKWHEKNNRLRLRMMNILKKSLPEFEVRVGGLTSIDVTRKGIDKAYGIRQIEKHLGVSRKEMLFVGDALYPGGNDYAAVKTGVDWVQVSGPGETKKVIQKIIR